MRREPGSNAEPDWTTPVIEWQESRMRIARLTYCIGHCDEVRTASEQLDLSLGRPV